MHTSPTKESFNKYCLHGKGGGVENHENNGYLHYGWPGMGLEFWCEILEKSLRSP